mmetsp:Transcript_29994/g.62368  ORF Transcript_29994/g.62368 Transcript_29994/m.62368 type:complete len:204 (-) Transcript_29994:268-879(-)
MFIVIVTFQCRQRSFLFARFLLLFHLLLLLLLLPLQLLQTSHQHLLLNQRLPLHPLLLHPRQPRLLLQPLLLPLDRFDFPQKSLLLHFHPLRFPLQLLQLQGILLPRPAQKRRRNGQLPHLPPMLPALAIPRVLRHGGRAILGGQFLGGLPVDGMSGVRGGIARLLLGFVDEAPARGGRCDGLFVVRGGRCCLRLRLWLRLWC